MTQELYLNDTYLFTCRAIISKQDIDAKGPFVCLDKTNFYPQGGGQPADQGIIKNSAFELKIIDVRKIEDEIRHYFSGTPEQPLVNQKIECHIDQNRRILNAKYHTGGHLLSNIIEQLYPQLKAVKGHHFPGEAYVEFTGELQPDENLVANSIAQAIYEAAPIKIFETTPEIFETNFYKLPYATPANKAFRVMQIEGFLPLPCGGTHLTTCEELNAVKITKMKSKAERLKVSYAIET